MSFQLATAAAPEDADYIAYSIASHNWVIIYRRSDGILNTCANTDSIGFDV